MQEMRNNFFFKETHIELHMATKIGGMTPHTHTHNPRNMVTDPQKHKL